MKLNDIRKLAIRQNFRLRFPLANGMECVVDEHGIARVPGLKSPPDFNLEAEFGHATQFVLETLGAKAAAPRKLSAQELAAMAGAASAGAATAAHADDHDE